MRDAFKELDPGVVERRIDELKQLQAKQAWENRFFRRGTTAGKAGSTEPRDKVTMTSAQSVSTEADRTDPPGGSSVRSLSRDVVDRAYATAGKAIDGKIVESECDPDKKDTIPGEDKDVDWGAPITDKPTPDDHDNDDPKNDDDDDEDLDDADQIRKLLRNRPPSLVLLTAHRMIGILGNVGEHTSIDTADAPDWSSVRVENLIEDIINTCEAHNLLVENVQRFIKKEAKFLDKERRASLVKTRGSSDSSRSRGTSRNMSQDDDKASQTSASYYDSDVHTDKNGCEFVTRNRAKLHYSCNLCKFNKKLTLLDSVM